jgi:archaellum component FlaC
MSALNFPAGASMCLVATTSAKTINLPTPDTGRFVYIVDSTGGANQFPITVSTTGTGVAICNGLSTIVQPFGTLGFLANNNNWYAIINESGINNLRTLTASNISVASVSTNYGFFSTISTGSVYGRHIGDGSLLTGLPAGGISILPPIMSTIVMSSGIITGNLISTTRLSTAFGYISSLTVDSLSFGIGNGFINMGDIITTSMSSIQTFTSSLITTNLQVGIVSSLSYIAFPGLQLGYNQSVIAEQSTGTGLQELLVFRGSSASDRIRMQTTGSIVFEPGVSARFFPSALSNVTPAMIINTSSNVGIGIAAPTVALDVAGTGRFQILSTQQIFVSTISSGSVFGRFVGDGSLLTGLPAAGLTSLPPNLSTNFLSTGFLSASNISAFTMSTNFGFFSTISAGSIYSRFIGDGSLLTAIPNTGAVLAVSNLVNTNVSNITTISNLLNSVSTNVTTVSTNLNTLSNNVTTVSNTAGTNGSNITTISNLLNSVSTNVITISTNLNTLSNNVTTVSNTAGTNGSNITTISNLLNSVSTNVTTVSTNLNTLSNNVTTVSNTAGTNGSNITTISNLLNSVSTNVTTVSTNLNTLSNNVTTVSNLLNSVSTNVTTVSTNLNTLSNNVTTISNTGATVSNTVNYLLGVSNYSAITMSTSSGFFSTISTGTVFGRHIGDGSLLTNVPFSVPAILSTNTLSTGFLSASNISAFTMSTNFGFFSTISTGTVFGKHVGDGSLLTNLPVAGIPSVLSTQAFFTSSISSANITSAQGYISSLTVDALSFGLSNSYISMGDVITTSISTVQTFTSSLLTTNLQVGNVSSLSYIAFPGLQLGYNQSVIAEQSTGTGLQELLVFRGSSASDRIRMQTTGSIVFEPGVSARVYPAALSNVTPAMIINSSSNVGIGIAAPTVALDVAGTGRFQMLSTQQIFVSSISSGSIYGRFFGDGSALTGISAGGGGGAALSTFTTMAVQFSTVNISSLFLMKANISSVAFGTPTSSLGQVYIGDLKNQLNFSTAQDATFLLEQQLPMSNTFVSTFRATGFFNVPQNVNFLNVHMWGSGGSNGGGGGGAYIRGTLPVSSGSILRIAVNAGFGNSGSAAGGGYAGIFLSSIAVNNILAIAGGGGASGSRTSDSGGFGGVLLGGAGGYGGVGQGGTIPGGQTSNTSVQAWQLQGEAQNAGGGGGFWGGGGGYNNSVVVVGGAGGSSYISNLLNFYGENGTSAIGGGVGGGKGTQYNNGTYGDAGTLGAVVLVWSPSLRRANLMTIQDAFSRRVVVTESLNMGINVSTPNSNLTLEVAGIASLSSIITANISTASLTVPYSNINAAATTSSLGIYAMRTISNGQQIAFGTTGALGSVTPFGPVGKNSQIYINDVKNYLGNVSTSDAVVLIEQDMSLLSNTNVQIIQISTSVGYTVPAGVTAIRAFMWGGGGTNYPNGGSGGAGAFIAGTFNVTPGERLSTVVNYGGGGGTYGGGGLSGIFRGAISQGNTIGIAAGGGAGSSHPIGGGGFGGVLTGGQAFYRWSPAGGNATQTAAGTGGGNGSALQGGGNVTGGGGGYFGGAGNGNNSVDVVGGGGGSSYIAGMFNVLAENGQTGNYAGNNVAGGQWAPFASNWGNPTIGGRIFMVYNTRVRQTNLLELRTGYTSSITAITNFNTMGINVSSVLSSITLDVGGQGRFVTLSSQQLFTSTISSGSIFGRHFGDGSGLTGLPAGSIPQVLSTLAFFTSSISTTTIQTSNLQIGTISSQSFLAFPGLQQQYSQSVLAEVSTGTGLQEMLLFRGSTATDRIRMQTTGSIIFETGVGARVFPAAPSNATPAMIINTSSNVGIGIAAPTVTLDVAGAGRFQTLSTQQIYTSSVIAGVVSSATVTATTVSSLAGFFSTVNNYQIGGALYLPTQIFTF